MSDYKDQPTSYPTRKILAVIVSGMIIGAMQSLLNLFWPDHPFYGLMEELDIWVQALVMVVAGYMVRERDDE